MKTIYTLCKGNEDDHAVRSFHSYEYLEDAIQEARERNESALARMETRMEDVCGLWRQDRGEDISELLTAGLTDKELGKIANLARVELGHELSELNAINEVIYTCLEGGELPHGWWGIMASGLHEEGEEEV